MVQVVYSGGVSPPDKLFVSLLSVLVIKHRLAMDRAVVQWGFLWSFPKGIFVVIDTHWVLCNCLMTHRFCVLAGGLCLCSPPLGVLR